MVFYVPLEEWSWRGCPSCGTDDYDCYATDDGEQRFHCCECGYDGERSEVEVKPEDVA